MEHANAADYYKDKVLTETDITGKFSIPSGWIEQGKLLPVPVPGSDPIPIQVKHQHNNENTILRLKVRKPREDKTKCYMKPEFMYKEWQAVRRMYDLKKGEKVYFWMDGGYLGIKARDPPKATQLFGRIIVDYGEDI